MNYRHQYHAGNFADVLKHATLLHLLTALQTKEKGILYLDTHAGRGGYDLAAAASGGTLPRAPEWPNGLGRLLARPDLPEGLVEYVAAVRAFDAATSARTELRTDDGTPRFYPGSPRLALTRLRPQDRAVFCERQPDEASALAAEFVGVKRTTVSTCNGYAGVRALLPPPERRALVLIDPPFETQDEWTQIITALGEGLARLPGATFAVWYPLTARARVDLFYRQLLGLPKLPPCFTVELLIGGEQTALKVWGCGVLVINPPWGSAQPLDALARWLAPVLSQAEGARGGVHWLVPET